MCMMFAQCNTQWLYTLGYNINGSVATSRAMPTPFYLSIMKLVSFGPSSFMYIITIYMSLIIAWSHAP